METLPAIIFIDSSQVVNLLQSDPKVGSQLSWAPLLTTSTAQVLQEIGAKMEIHAQKVKWSILMAIKLVREWSKQGWAEEEVELE